MKDISTICPVCEADIVITARELKLASQHRKETGGKVLVILSGMLQGAGSA